MSVRNHQVGTPLVNRRPPTLTTVYRGNTTVDITGTRVRGGTWQLDKVDQTTDEMDEVEEIFNITAYNRGERIQCDLLPKSGYEPEVLDVIEESAASAAQALLDGIEIFEVGGKRRWVVKDPITEKQFGKRDLIFGMKLYRGRNLDTTLIEADS